MLKLSHNKKSVILIYDRKPQLANDTLWCK